MRLSKGECVASQRVRGDLAVLDDSGAVQNQLQFARFIGDALHGGRAGKYRSTCRPGRARCRAKHRRGRLAQPAAVRLRLRRAVLSLFASSELALQPRDDGSNGFRVFSDDAQQLLSGTVRCAALLFPLLERP